MWCRPNTKLWQNVHDALWEQLAQFMFFITYTTKGSIIKPTSRNASQTQETLITEAWRKWSARYDILPRVINSFSRGKMFEYVRLQPRPQKERPPKHSERCRPAFHFYIRHGLRLLSGKECKPTLPRAATGLTAVFGKILTSSRLPPSWLLDLALLKGLTHSHDHNTLLLISRPGTSFTSSFGKTKLHINSVLQLYTFHTYLLELHLHTQINTTYKSDVYVTSYVI